MTINELSFLVLTSLADEPRHGYAILREVGAITEGAVVPQVATLYRTVDRLVADGLIEEHATEVVDGRFRRSYRLTDVGEAELSAEASLRAATARLATTRLRRPAVDRRPAGGIGLAGGPT